MLAVLRLQREKRDSYADCPAEEEGRDSNAYCLPLLVSELRMFFRRGGLLVSLAGGVGEPDVGWRWEIELVRGRRWLANLVDLLGAVEVVEERVPVRERPIRGSVFHDLGRAEDLQVVLLAPSNNGCRVPFRFKVPPKLPPSETVEPSDLCWLWNRLEKFLRANVDPGLILSGSKRERYSSCSRA